jgi:hypothetical protein
MLNLARILIVLGIILIVVGGVLFLASRLNLPLGRLPGDIRIQRENFSFYFPLTSGIIISVLLTVLLNLIIRLLKR